MAIPNVTTITEGSDTGGGSFSLTLPGSSTAYLLIMSLMGGTAQQNITSAPANWTLLQDQTGDDSTYAHLVVYYANASASPGTSVTVTTITEAASSWLVLGLDVAISSINQEAWTSHAGEPGSFTSPTVTTNVDGCLIVRCAAGDMYNNAACVLGYPGSTNDNEQRWTDAGNPTFHDGAMAAVATTDQASQGATGTVTWTDTTGTMYSPIGGTFAVVGAAGDATVTPAAIAATVAMPAAHPNVAAAPAAIVAAATPRAPAVSVAAAPAQVVTAAALPAPTVSVGAAPNRIVTTVTMPQATPTESGSVTAQPATIATVATLPAPAVSVGVAPVTVVAVGSLPAPSISVGAAPATLQAGVAFPVPAVSVGAAPTLLPAVVAIPQATPDGGAGTPATVTPGVIAAVVTMPAPVVSVGVAPAQITALVAVPQAVPAISKTVTPDAIATVIAIPSPVVSVGAAPQVLAVTISLPQASPQTGGGYQIHGRLTVILGGISPPPTGGPAGVIG